jgi:toxin-antitoxin system PIN domain toxin
MIDLLDASVWVPLSAPDHVHHDRARRYWENESAEQVAFCRVTALALLRHLTNPHIMRHAVLTGSEAWDAYERWLTLPEIVFLAEPEGIDDHLRRMSRSVNPGPALWTDAYLVAFALTSGLRLVAFDAHLSRFDDLNLLRLWS